MRRFEKRNIQRKEQRVFGKAENADTRTLGWWMEPAIDTNNRKKRVGNLWAKMLPQLANRLTECQQAIFRQTRVENGLLFEIASQSWQKREMKSTQQWIDRRYQ